jgi:PII-like signaling protein
MNLPEEAELLRIYISEGDKWGDHPLYEVIVREARKRGMAGATVLRGLLGFGADSRMHTAKILRLSEDLPLVVEIIDKSENIDAFLPELDRMIKDGLVTRERIRVAFYRNSPSAPKL